MFCIPFSVDIHTTVPQEFRVSRRHRVLHWRGAAHTEPKPGLRPDPLPFLPLAVFCAAEGPQAHMHGCFTLRR